MLPSDPPGTLVSLLQRAAVEKPEVSLRFPWDDEADDWPYAALYAEARRIAGGLRSEGLAPGRPVLLPIRSPAPFVRAFWGVVLAGLVPVPLPAPTRPDEAAAERLRAVQDTLAAAAVVAPRPEALVLEAQASPRLPLDALSTAAPLESVATPSPDARALLQFSSGSTGRPTGVPLTHRNILANIRAVARHLGLGPEDAGSNWMPLFHDMGLIGYHLVPLSAGIPQYHLQTRRFLRAPLRWLDHLTEAPVTVTAAPNFGQALLLRHLDRPTDGEWDLSSVRLVLNGAEPIAPSVQRNFVEALASYGLAPEALLPVYGLAEATLAVTMPSLEADPTVAALDRSAVQSHRRAEAPDADAEAPLRYVSVGRPIEGCEVRIVDDDGQPLPERQVGHVQVRGPSVATGPYAGATESPVTDAGWLRTGDLGFQRAGDLYVTGRADDVVIVRGQNLHANDLERAVINAVPAVRPGKVVACAAPEADEGGVVLFLAGHPSETMAEWVVSARQALRRRFGLSPIAEVPVAAREIPRTTSGKVQRYRLQDTYAEGAFDDRVRALNAVCAQRDGGAPARVPPRTTSEQLLHALWCRELGRPAEEVGVHDHFVDDLGGTSVQAAAILGALETEHRLHVPSDVLAERGTIAALADYLDAHPARAASSSTPRRTRFRG